MNEAFRQNQKDVIFRILHRSRKGNSLNERSVKSDIPDLHLHRSALAHFGTWQSAVARAGVGTRLKAAIECEGPTEVLRSIRRLCYAGRCLKTKSVKNHQYPLYEAAVKHFGGWIDALKAAGINSAQIDAHSNWDRERIIEAILLRAVENRALGSTTVRPSSLKTAAVGEFGSWENALRVAGLKPKEYIGRWTTHCRKECSRRMWDRQRIIKAIQQRAVLGLPLDHRSVCRDDRSLVNAARSYFGDWQSALECAGLDSVKALTG